jgi:ring-1,2-phenylacetyl-CoA epoxidase subunit PaaA
LEIPDKDLYWDEKKNSGSGGYVHGPINWEEFWDVIKGNGPMNKERISMKRKAWDEGRWVRDASKAYGLKNNSSAMAAE